jgi:glycosyltransferase involved in cell wall biosynthesis
MTNKKVSIIVVSLNTKYFFLKTVKSALAQSHEEKEIIVVDGNSTDGTIDTIKKMKKEFSKIIIEKDKGIYDAMNKGSHLASGDWIIFLNSGDVFYNKNVLSDVFEQPVANKDIIYGNTFVKNKGINYLIQGKFFSKKTICMPFCHQSVLVKKNIVKKNKFSLIYRYSSDFNFFIKCFSRKNNFYNLNLTIATVLANGVSDNNRQKVYSENIKILKKYNSNFFIILNLWMLKLSNLIKDCIKYIFPESILLLILKFKYQKQNRR